MERRSLPTLPGSTTRQMSQLFSRHADFILRFSIIGGVLVIIIAVFVSYKIATALPIVPPKNPPSQPVPFSHLTHAGELSIDCRYCHESVEISSYAGIPSLSTCMGCHEQVWQNSPLLLPLRNSANGEAPLVWSRVYDLPDFSYFDHSIHVNKGFACETCHGRVDQMPTVWKATPMTMIWCLDCHRSPEKFIRPLEDVYDFGWEAPPGWEQQAAALVHDYGVRRLTDCTTCHR